MDPTIYVPDNEHYDNTPRGSLPPIGNLPDSWGPVTPMNHNKYRTTVVTLTTRLPSAFGWLVGDAEWAMGIVRGAHGGELGEFFHRGNAMTQGATERLMAAYLTWRGARQEVSPPGTLMPPPQRSKPARKSARGGVGDRSPSPHPPHPQPVGSGPRPHARKDEWSGVGERPTPDAPHPGKRRPPRAPSCRPHSAPSQHARARAVGLVKAPHARTPRTHSQWVAGPSRTPQRTGGRGWESAQPRTPHTEARGAHPRHPRAAPRALKASSQECALWGW